MDEIDKIVQQMPGVTEAQMDRKEQMQRLRDKGLSYQAIGSLFGCSRQRVHQVVGGYGWRKAPSEHEWYLWFLSIPPETPAHELAARTCKWLMGERRRVPKQRFDKNPKRC